ncbi:MAG: hypothetical protein JW795_13975, partial [Chitinivibrionales bacterium]|nr:hypothetical protein [Chitinivibrionales bacterium]
MKDGNTLFLCGKFTIKKRKTLKSMRVPLTVAMLFPVLLFSLEIKARTTGEVGPYTWAHLPAQSLRNPTPMSSGSGSSSFVGGIGGVTFDQTAKPQEGTKVTALSLGYDPEEPDAQRLTCTINGKD